MLRDFDRFAGGDSVLYYDLPGRDHFDIGAKYLHYSELESGVDYLYGSTGELENRGQNIDDRNWCGDHPATATTLGQDDDKRHPNELLVK